MTKDNEWETKIYFAGAVTPVIIEKLNEVEYKHDYCQNTLIIKHNLDFVDSKLFRKFNDIFSCHSRYRELCRINSDSLSTNVVKVSAKSDISHIFTDIWFTIYNPVQTDAYYNSWSGMKHKFTIPPHNILILTFHIK